MSFNPLDPTQMARAKGVVAKIKERLDEGQFKARMADITASERPTERNYRQTGVDVDKARRELSDAKSSLGERDAELVMAAASLTVTTQKPRFATDATRKTELANRTKADKALEALASQVNVDQALLKESEAQTEKGLDEAALKERITLTQDAVKAREVALAAEVRAEVIEEETPRYPTEGAKKNGAIGLRKADEEYLALKGTVRQKEEALEAAERAFADAKADQRVLMREDQRLRDDKAFAAACILAFADLDVPALAAVSLATSTPHPAAA
jgi:hypothetical protein